MKAVVHIKRPNGSHWVGDGFPVKSIFSYHDIAEQVSPFLLMDYAGPVDFPPTKQKLGVGQHPHRGFETVTIVYQGGVSHRDSSGGGGSIGPGDVQWMTAASGVIHEEYHSPAFAAQGGAFEMIQLWVNLPAKHKMAAPRYQSIAAREIPEVALPEGGTARLIAGSLGSVSGPARTFTPMIVWDLHLKAGQRSRVPTPEGWTTALFARRGSVLLGDGSARVSLAATDLAVLEREGGELPIEAAGLLLLVGQPLEEPIVGHGPFVMNTADEIVQAVHDYRTGRFGQIH